MAMFPFDARQTGNARGEVMATNVTTVPEPSTMIFLFFAACLAASIFLLCKPRMRVAGIVMLVGPLVLVMFAAAWRWSAPARATP